MSAPAWDAVLLHADDDVAVVLRAVADGETVRVRASDRTFTITARTAIALAHKIALNGVAAGSPVRKYGEIIGEARAAIAAGDHVHVHNIASRRARRS